MDTITVGDATVVLTEEMVDTSFTAECLYRPVDPERLGPHLDAG